MAARVTHRSGAMETVSGPTVVAELVAELDHDDDAEHPDIAIAHESGWSLSALTGGLVVWENVDEGEPRHMAGLSRDQVRNLFDAVVASDLGVVEAQPWEPGYGA